MTLSDFEPLVFCRTFTQWLTLRRFSGFDLEEFQDAEACAEAEEGFADHFEQCETALLAHVPAGFVEMACQLEIIRGNDDLTPSGRDALKAIQSALVAGIHRTDGGMTADEDILVRCLVAEGLDLKDDADPASQPAA